MVEILQGYGVLEETVEGIDEHIVPPGLGDESGIAGAFALAEGVLGVQPGLNGFWARPEAGLRPAVSIDHSGGEKCRSTGSRVTR